MFATGPSTASTRRGGIAIGSRLAEQLGVGVGDKVSLIIAKGAQTPFGVMPRIKAYPVVAIFSIGMSEFDSLFLYMPLPEAQTFFNRREGGHGIEVFVDNPDKIDDFTSAVGKLTGPPLIVMDWRQRNKTFFDTLQVEKNVLFIILMLIVVVAAFNIVSGLIMLVKDKTQRHRDPAHHGRDARACPAHLHAQRRLDRRRSGTLFGLVLGVAFARQYRANPS